MKKIFCIFGLALLLLSACSDDNQQRKAAAPQNKPVAPQQQASAPLEQEKDAGIWPPPQENQQSQENILPADQWTRKNYVMIFDGSGSMADKQCSGTKTKNAVAQEAVAEWAQSVPADAHLGLIVFDQNGFSVRQQLDQGDRQTFVQQVRAVVPSATTPLTKAVQTAYQLLTDQARRQLGYGEYHIVIVTDGAANLPEELTHAVNAVLAHSPIIISTIGFCIADTHSLNQPGRTIYKAADNPEALRQGLQDILAESESFDDVTDF